MRQFLSGRCLRAVRLSYATAEVRTDRGFLRALTLPALVGGLLCLVAALPGAAHAEESAANVATEAQLTEKLAELTKLQVEVDELRRKLGKEQQISIWCQLVEVDLTKLENAAIEWSKLGPISGAPSPFSAVTPEGGPELPQFVEALRRKNIAKLIADPTLITMSGRPASFRQGGEIAVPAEKQTGVQYKQLGMQMDAVAYVTGAKRIRMELRVKSSELNPETTMTVNGERLPGVNVREFDTGLEVNDGEVSVLSWPEQVVNEVTTDEATGVKTENTRKLKTFCLVRVDLIDPAGKSAPTAKAVQAEAATTRRR